MSRAVMAVQPRKAAEPPEPAVIPGAPETVRGYRAHVARAITPLRPRLASLDDADGTVLAGDITAAHPLPLFRNSAMDGYAVAARDLTEAAPGNPVVLPIAGEVAAGDTRQIRLAPGTCVRIMTGAPVPDGADAVVRREWVTETHWMAAFTRPAAPGDSVRPAGGEVRPGAPLLAAGTPLGPAQLGLLAAAGQQPVLVRPRPRVTVLSAGNELLAPGTPTAPGQAWESNSFMLASAARRLGCTVRRGPAVPDDRTAVLTALREAAAGADLIITSGGISMGGEHDVFKAALRDLGTVRFHRVALRPGAPQGFGTIGDPPVPVLLLPGNPAAAFVSFALFAEAAVRALQGIRSRLPLTRTILTAPIPAPAPGRTSFYGALRHRAAGTVTPVGTSLHALTGLAQADALIMVDAGGPVAGPGDSVPIVEIGW